MIRLALALLLASAPAARADTLRDSLLREHLWHQVRALPKNLRPTVGLVLSAGAVRGLAHIGVINVLEDAGFPVDVVSGTSMGAVIGSFYAGGVAPEQLWELGRSIRLSSGNNFSAIRLLQLLINDSLLSTKNMELLMRDTLGDRRFDELPKPFACVAMDIRTGEKIIFRDGPLGPAVRASMNLPGLFKPVLYRHRYLVDGGVVDYIPVDAAKLLGADWIIASVTEGDFSDTNPKNVLMTLEQVIDIRGSILSRQQRKDANFVIEPNVGDVHYYDVERAEEVIETGMIAAKSRISPAKEALILHSLPLLWRQEWSAP